MSVFKIEKNGNYTVMSNYHLRDRNLSYKAKGLLSFMLSLPEDWDYSMSGLESISKESIKAIRNILQELEDNKYLVRTRMQNELGKFYYDYSIYEIPFDIDPYYQKGNTVKGQTEKGIQINTNIINTKEQIDKGDKTKSSFFTSGEHNPLTINLINRGYLSEKRALYQKYYFQQINFEIIVPKLRWITVDYPSISSAQQFGMSTDEYENYFFDAVLEQQLELDLLLEVLHLELEQD